MVRNWEGSRILHAAIAGKKPHGAVISGFLKSPIYSVKQKPEFNARAPSAFVPLDRDKVCFPAMRIARIKLAGFKSFVDPTTLHLPGNLTGIVGPNGCGKSNIIDAMLWVMGETSAKQLRGDSMADVIFSGSNTRKPVGQASVELVFDNADGTIGGPYSGFAEISIKRTVGRDGNSNYYLNGTRCRRKDILDVFLGTGLGVRGGYSVIEQGMISRVIEAKPEELRNFLEEAAGISRYKERRRETETRIRHTNENLERVNDIRLELEKQLTRLQRQAKAAEQYQALKSEERQLEADYLAIRWQGIERARQQQHLEISARETELEAALAALRKLENEQTAQREAQTAAQGQFNSVQSAFYAKSAEISRIEQAIQLQEERHRALEQELGRARLSQNEALGMLNGDRTRLAEMDAAIDALTPLLTDGAAGEESAAETLRHAEQSSENWQQVWDQFNREFTEISRTEHAGQARVELLARDQQDATRRIETLGAERGRLDPASIETRVAELKALLVRKTAEIETLRQEQQAVRESLAGARETAQSSGRQLHARRAEGQEVRGKLASLRALQEAALGRDQRSLMQWLAGNGLGESRALAESLSIEPGWELAAETAIGARLTALCGAGVDERLLATPHAQAPAAVLNAVGRAALVPGVARTGAPTLPRLLDKITSASNLEGLLGSIYISPDLETAQAHRAALAAHESIVTANGVWLGPNWVQVPGRRQADDSVLVRERRLDELRREDEQLTGLIAGLESEQRQSQDHQRQLEKRDSELSAQLNARNGELNDLRGRTQRAEGELAQTHNRLQELTRQSGELAQRAETSVRELDKMRADVTALRVTLAALEERRGELTEQRRQVQVALEQARATWRQARDARHALALQLESLKSGRGSLAHAIERNQRLSEELALRCETLANGAAEAIAPQAALRAELDTALAARIAGDQALKAARQRLEEIDQQLRGYEEHRGALEKDTTERQRVVEQARLEERALQVRAQEQAERLAQGGHTLESVIEALAPDASEEACREKLTAIGNRIGRLGPINLAAIDEYSQTQERKTYLDAQYTDLTQALATLEDAMRKIDKETRTRFRETFDQVNAGLQRLFPILFGGGHAYLELTGEDLLETGVTVMARPPGKRNSSIHLLSGGEKALSALSFVFALFELNPAPFCLLDEVDAPLDDANVVRLTAMLRQMSAHVQFLFISHNKVTMEIAEQLIGVTMHEPGVSRLVSVNMDEAVRLAGSA